MIIGLRVSGYGLRVADFNKESLLSIDEYIRILTYLNTKRIERSESFSQPATRNP